METLRDEEARLELRATDSLRMYATLNWKSGAHEFCGRNSSIIMPVLVYHCDLAGTVDHYTDDKNWSESPWKWTILLVARVQQPRLSQPANEAAALLHTAPSIPLQRGCVTKTPILNMLELTRMTTPYILESQ